MNFYSSFSVKSGLSTFWVTIVGPLNNGLIFTGKSATGESYSSELVSIDKPLGSEGTTCNFDGQVKTSSLLYGELSCLKVLEEL